MLHCCVFKFSQCLTSPRRRISSRHACKRCPTSTLLPTWRRPSLLAGCTSISSATAATAGSAQHHSRLMDLTSHLLCVVLLYHLFVTLMLLRVVRYRLQDQHTPTAPPARMAFSFPASCPQPVPPTHLLGCQPSYPSQQLWAWDCLRSPVLPAGQHLLRHHTPTLHPSIPTALPLGTVPCRPALMDRFAWIALPYHSRLLRQLPLCPPPPTSRLIWADSLRSTTHTGHLSGPRWLLTMAAELAQQCWSRHGVAEIHRHPSLLSEVPKTKFMRSLRWRPTRLG